MVLLEQSLIPTYGLVLFYASMYHWWKYLFAAIYWYSEHRRFGNMHTSLKVRLCFFLECRCVAAILVPNGAENITTLRKQLVSLKLKQRYHMCSNIGATLIEAAFEICEIYQYYLEAPLRKLIIFRRRLF